MTLDREAMAGKRVLIIVENYSVPQDRRVWLESLALVSAGYLVSVICPGSREQPSYELREGVHIHRYPSPPVPSSRLGFAYEFAYSWLATVRLTARVLRLRGFDIIQACNPPDTYFALAAPFKALGKPFVFDQHDLSPEVYVSRFGSSGRAALTGLRLLEQATYRTADHVISPNRWYREIVLDRGHKRDDAVTVVRNGPDLGRMRRRAPHSELRAGRRFLCCFVGVIEPHDGVDLALHAVDRLVHEHRRTDCHFAFLGAGDAVPQLLQLSEELGIAPYVTFPGWADDELLCDYLSTADVGLQPDPKDPRTDISTATKTMEYMAFSLPVVAFDLKETRSSAEGAAVYATPNDPGAFAACIAALLDSPQRRARMGATGRARVEESLAWDHQRRAYVGVYDRLLGANDQRVVDATSSDSASRRGRAWTAMRGGYLRLRSTINAWAVERYLRIETAEPVTLSELNLPTGDGVGYEPSGWLDLRRALPRGEVDGDDVLLDLGCGKGRVLAQAARYPLRRIFGVELSPELAAVAEANIASMRGTIRCKDVRVLIADAASFPIPDDVTVIYLYNPFGESTLKRMVDNILESLDRHPRRLRLIYRTPMHHDYLRETGRFELARSVPGLRPTKALVASASTHVYEVR